MNAEQKRKTGFHLTIMILFCIECVECVVANNRERDRVWKNERKTKSKKINEKQKTKHEIFFR